MDKNNVVIWNAWHGCHRVSPGCNNCYMFSTDIAHDVDPENVHMNKDFNMPVLINRRTKEYKVPAGSIIRANLNTDTFLLEAREWFLAFETILCQRQDCFFHIITKRPQNIATLVTDEFYDLDNVLISITCENQKMLDTRMEIMKDSKLKRFSLCLAPMLENMDLRDYLVTLPIVEVSVSGERAHKARAFNYDWALHVRKQCIEANCNFVFFETGSNFIKDGKTYYLGTKKLQNEQATKASIDFLPNELFRRDGV